jgi:FtsP/CotA-like multicopper oxidase with cupredoxin domain
MQEGAMLLSRRLLPLLAFVTFLGGVAAAPAAGPSPALPEHPCGPPLTGREIARPPDVEMWNAPLDAQGEHELILAVHKDGDRYCYRYTWNGVTETVAPTIRVKRGERFAIRIVNDIAAQSKGETVPSTALPACKPMMMPDAPVHYWVGYLNHTIDDRRMPIAGLDVNLHLHGFEGPAAMENVFLSSLSTPMHACEYDITIPATQPPGTYVYHPHAHGASDIEVAGGLDGAWIVQSKTPELPLSAQHVLVVRYRIPFELDNKFQPDDGGAIIRLAEQHEGAREPALPVPYDPFNPPPWPVTYPMHGGGVSLDPTGCQGLGSEVVVQVDGADAPASLSVPSGQTQLLRIVNGTSDTSELFTLRDGAGDSQPLQVASLDGIPVSGDMERPLAHHLVFSKLMLTPMGRASILLAVPAGETYTLALEHYCSGADAFFEMHHDLIHIEGAPGGTDSIFASRPEAAEQTPAAKLVAFARAHPKLIRRRAIAFTEYAFPKSGRTKAHQAFYITDITNPDFHEHPFWPSYRNGATVPDRADIVVKQGSIEEWSLINTTMESHGFHIHQMAFVQENSAMGVPVTLDTAFVPVGKLLPNPRDPNYPLVKPSITKVLLDFRHVPKGTFVFHCHMLFHEDHGMMGVIRVV